MKTWVRATEGVSWQAAPGVRRWRSMSVGVSAFWFGAGLLFWYGVIWPLFLLPLWLIAECNLLFFTALICLAGMAVYHSPPEALHIRRAGWFWVFDLDLPPGR